MVEDGRYVKLLSQLTREEKAALLSGENFWYTKAVQRLGIPAVLLTDGPHGLRKQNGDVDNLGLNAGVKATCFPTASALANSWDTALLERVGAAIGAEAAAEQVSVLLGPGINIKRNPLGGRNFEYFSEDPLLTGVLAAHMIRGIQSRGVAACVKHFAVNSQETHRLSIDEVVDERALHELYLPAFRIAVTDGQVQAVMSSYNKVNGTHANEHTQLLTDILRNSWGFDGLVVSDWGGNYDTVKAVAAGGSLVMPASGPAEARKILAALAAGELAEEHLDARVSEVLRLIERAEPGESSDLDFAAQHELAVEAARRCVVLLANPHATLPLSPASGRIAVIGNFAATPRYQGAGSSIVNPTRVDTALDSLNQSGLTIVGYEPGFKRQDAPSKKLKLRALALAQQADLVLLFLGLDECAESEGFDRAHMRLADNQLQLIDALHAQGSRVVVVLAGGSPVELPFADRCEAIVHGYLGGQGAGRAIVDVLTGRANPSAKLAESYPLTYEQVPSAASFAKTEATSEHRESIYLGYRYFDKVAAEVRYPFGHGLSYTTFEYSDLVADSKRVKLKVKNTGTRDGAEVVQLYVAAPDGAAGEFRAVQELRGFARVELAAGQSQEVEIAVAEHAFEYFDPQQQSWQQVPGHYTMQVGSSSRDIRLSSQVHITGGSPMNSAAADLPSYATGQVSNVSDAEYERLLGRKLPPRDWPVGEPLTRDSLVLQAKGRGGFGGFIVWMLETTRKTLNLVGKPIPANYTRLPLDMPYRSFVQLSAGAVTEDMLDGLLMMVNRKFFRGLRHFLAARKRAKIANKQESTK